MLRLLERHGLKNCFFPSRLFLNYIRYEEIKDKLSKFLKKCGFQLGKDVTFMPCAGSWAIGPNAGEFIKDVPDESVCSWCR
jgi:translation elongation factor EF-1alpha